MSEQNEIEKLKAQNARLREAARHVHKLVDELCEAVDLEMEDIGGHRGSLVILKELGPAWDDLDAALGDSDDQ